MLHGKLKRISLFHNFCRPKKNLNNVIKKYLRLCTTN